MRTERLYYQDTDRTACEARILERAELEGRPAVILDQTIFYPEGGGQPADRGFIADSEVVDVQERDGEIFHILAGPPPAGDGPFLCRIDGERRRDHAEQHTGQHLLSALTLRLAGGATKSFHLGQDSCTIDIDLPELTREASDAIEDAAAAIIRENHPVMVHECPPGDASRFPLRRPPPQGEEVLRVVDLDGLDYSACCGTHLPNTGRIGALRILRTEKYKGMTRVYFVAGERARMEARRVARIARETARVLGCGEDEVPERTARGTELAKDLANQLSKTRSERAAAEARVFLSAAPTEGVHILPLSDRAFEEILEDAKALSAASGRPALAGSRQALRAVAAAPDASFRLGERLKPLLAEAGGKGGGGPAQFQAQFPDEAGMLRFLEAARKAFL